MPAGTSFSGHVRRACLALLLALSCGHAAAENSFALRGFGTLGLTYNGDDGFEYIRDQLQSSGVENGASTKVDSDLGLQLRYRFLPTLDGVVQVVSRHDQDGSFPPELTWAYLKYSPSPAWQIRGGRMAWDVYMLYDNRNVGYTLPWVRPPVEYFGIQQLSHIDGADAVFTRPLGRGVFWLKLYGGFADDTYPLDGGDEYDLSGSGVLGGHADYKIGDWWFRLSYSDVKLDNKLDSLQPLFTAMRANNQTSAELADDMQLKGADIGFLVFGTVYESGPLQAQLMVDRTHSETLLFNDFYSGYAAISYRLGEWTPYASFAAIQSDRISRDSGFPAGSGPDQTVQTTLQDRRFDQQTLSLGLRYDFHENMTLKLQVDRMRAHSPETSLMRNAESGWDGRSTIVSVALDFVY